MPIKVLIVDDEKLERILIRNGFSWTENGFEVIGEASSGKEALEFARHRRPDIVLTDINMPSMDGLQLSEHLLNLYPDCRIIIITGYREFDYARKAVKLGVQDFLLKPIDVKELAEVTYHLKVGIEKEIQQDQEIKELRQSVLTNKDVVMESFFQRLVEMRVPQEEAMQRLLMYNCEELGKQCVCINIKLVGHKDKQNINRNIQKVLEIIRRQKKADLVCFTHYLNNILVFFTDGQLETAKEFGINIHAVVNRELSLETTIGMSGLNKGFSGISQAFYQSDKACSASVLLGRNRFITFGEFEEIMARNRKKDKMEWKTLHFAIHNCLVEQADACMNDYIEIIRQTGITDVEYLRLNAIDILSKAGITLNKYGIGLSEIVSEEELYEAIRNISTLDEMANYLRTMIQKIMSFHAGHKNKKENKVVKETLRYVEEHLYDPGLSLKQVSANIFANESYLSRMFKKEMEINLITYITKKRIEESIRLLKTTDLKVYEIAEKIGFRESHYFSICFKKYTGLTIKEFKSAKI